MSDRVMALQSREALLALAILALIALIAMRFPGFVAPANLASVLQRHLAADHSGARPDGR